MRTGLYPTPASSFANAGLRFSGKPQPEKPVESSESKKNESPEKFYPPRPNRAVKGVTRVMVKGVGLCMRFAVEIPEDQRLRLEALKADTGTRKLYVPNHPTGILDLLTEELLNLGALRMSNVDNFAFQNPLVSHIPGLNKTWAWVQQANGAFSVDRASGAQSVDTAIDVMSQGYDLTMFIEGFITRTSDLVEKKNLKQGPVKVALGVVERGHETLLVPLAFSFEMRGKDKKIRKSLEAATGRLEKKVAKEVETAGFDREKALPERLDALLEVMVSEREKQYAGLYGLDFSGAQDEDIYTRLENIREKVLTHLEAEYDSTASGAHERRGRKLIGKIRLMQHVQRAVDAGKFREAEMPGDADAHAKFEELRQKVDDHRAAVAKFLQDLNATNDMVNLSMYPRDYLNNELPRLMETHAKLERDLRDKKGGMLGRLIGLEKTMRAYWRAAMVARVRVGEPINVGQVLKQHPDLDPNALIEHIFTHLHQEMQGNLE